MSDISILIADDHAMVREGMHRILERQPGIKVVGEACNGQEAVNMAVKLAPDVVLMDLHMPVLDGLEATRAIVSRCHGTRVLVLTMEKSDVTVLEAIRAGAWGYVLKEARSKDLVEAIRAVHEGRVGMDTAMAGKLVAEFRRLASDLPTTHPHGLTQREQKILAAVASGATNREVAQRLSLSEQTVKNTLSTVYQKLQVKNRVEAIAAFRSAGGVDLLT